MHTPAPNISQSAFFALPEVKALQDIQKRNPPSSKAWQDAEDQLIMIAARYNAAHFFV